MKTAENFLQQFFDISLIPADTTDERLGHYQSAAGDLAKRFKQTPRDAVSASRVAIDPRCPAGDPWFAIVQDSVKAHWKTFLANHHDAPRQICRSILLESLRQATSGDEVISSAVWNGTASMFPHVVGPGPEQNLIRDFLIGLRQTSEEFSLSEWSEDDDPELPNFEVEIKATKNSIVDRGALERGLSDAAGPHDSQSQSHGNPNPHWPNSAHNWSYQFAPRAASTITTEVNKAIADVTGPVKEGIKQLKPALKKYAETIREILDTKTLQNRRMIQLLWWRQALYSPKLEQGYRGLKLGGLTLAMPLDLAEISGAPVPQSVEYFLREALHAVQSNETQFSLSELIRNVSESEVSTQLLRSVSVEPVRRVSLLDFFAMQKKDILPDSIPAYVGIEATTSLALGDWVVWLLRDRLAEILTPTNPS